MESPQFLRRDAAAEYLKKTYGFGASRTLAKGVVSGDTPQFHKAGRIVLYPSNLQNPQKHLLKVLRVAKVGMF